MRGKENEKAKNPTKKVIVLFASAFERVYQIHTRLPFQSITTCKSIITQCSRHVRELIGPRLTSSISGALRHRSSFLPTWSGLDCAPMLSRIKPLINEINCERATVEKMKRRMRRLIIATELELERRCLRIPTLIKIQMLRSPASNKNRVMAYYR